ncbi:MAG: DUF389 domain-containing protein [Chloroflexi bacterium]|nr:DUF389 domain-containing protein [Chloroflexota bacterium]
MNLSISQTVELESLAAPEEYYARTVVVPMSRPDTAAEMLRIAGQMVHPVHGLVIALVISLGDAEQTNRVSDQVNQVVEDFRNADSGHRVELVTEMAVSVSRGILDVARERNANVILLGVQRPTQGRVKLGTVVENVIATAPCGVLIYRSAVSPRYDRVVVPIDGSLPSVIAMKLGASIASQHAIPLRQMSVQFDYHYDPEHETLIKRYEEFLPRNKDLKPRAIIGRNPAPEIVRGMTADDLLVTGFSQKTDFERNIINDLSNQLLNTAPGPVIMISQLEWHRGLRGAIEHGIARLNPQLTLVEQNELIWSAQKNASSNLDYSVMIVLSAALATLGLLTNSAAVIIGAMLVAPLMAPLSSFSTGMATGILHLTRRASVTLFAGVTLALLISIVMGVILPIDTPTDEMLARGSPNLLDAAIALVSGGVAAYATARKGIPAALAGVAIAAALMPPLCTIGLGIALRDIDLAIGANLLFLANIAFIIAAEYITFLWMGMHPTEDREGASLNQSRAWWIVLFVITIIVLLVFARLTSQAVDEAQIRERLQAEAFQGAAVVEYQVITSVPLEVHLLVQSDHPITPEEVTAAQQLIDELYKQNVDLTVVERQIVLPLDPVAEAASAALKAALPRAIVSDVAVIQGERVLVRANIRSSQAPSSAELEAAQAQISAAVGAGIDLDIAFLQTIQINGSAAGAEAEL